MLTAEILTETPGREGEWMIRRMLRPRQRGNQREMPENNTEPCLAFESRKFSHTHMGWSLEGKSPEEIRRPQGSSVSTVSTLFSAPDLSFPLHKMARFCDCLLYGPNVTSDKSTDTLGNYNANVKFLIENRIRNWKGIRAGPPALL